MKKLGTFLVTSLLVSSLVMVWLLGAVSADGGEGEVQVATASIFPKITGRVWEDMNRDGLQDAGEPGKADVTVNLHWDWPPSKVDTTTTDITGVYTFTVTPNLDHFIEVEALSDWDFSPQNAGDNSIDSDVDAVTGRSSIVNLFFGEECDLDAGLMPRLSSIGDYVWLDTDEDGIQDESEAGFNGVTVSLYQPGLDGSPGGGDDTLVITVTTNISGTYLFTDLNPDNYFVEFAAPINYVFTTKDNGDDTLDSDVDVATGQTVTTTLEAGEIDLTWDAGLHAKPTVITLSTFTASSPGDPLWLGLAGLTVLVGGGFAWRRRRRLT